MTVRQGARIFISGIVQGVGFRPFVFDLADRYRITGWIRNTSSGVDIAVDGNPPALDSFITALRAEAPPLSKIDEFRVKMVAPDGFTDFEIIPSKAVPGAFQPISPDVSLCHDCEQELFSPDDRRAGYPFINCTNCGPRFTIIKDIPYDRPNTTMATFELCQDCADEYTNPRDRRFHAQPTACPVCGPHIWLEVDERIFWEKEVALSTARKFLQKGKIVGIKGLGGFHLACDATNESAVGELRKRKLRVDKPFAVMMSGLEAVEQHCQLSPAASGLLTSKERPIVILESKLSKTGNSQKQFIAEQVAPGQKTLGVMLPYTPLHALLLEEAPDYPTALVMTSGNLSDEPIATENQEARDRLSDLADTFLLHNRDIHTRCDDSVVMVFDHEIYPVRRARGYAPEPIRLPFDTTPTLATGTELKNTFCLTRDRYAFLSHHIGDLENFETLAAFETGIHHYERLFRIAPRCIAYDLHPDYLATRYAFDRAENENLPTIGVQHHHAHIAACLVDNGDKGEAPVIGIALDGTGYGDDGAIWGGEFLLADYQSYQRLYHLKYIPMPGGESAIKAPWRLALAWLTAINRRWIPSLPPVQFTDEKTLELLKRQIVAGVNSPLTSSMGRLFDAVSALIGICPEINYEAQAAIELEALVDQSEEGHYPFAINNPDIDPGPLFEALLKDLKKKVPPEKMAARFHNGVARMVLEVCQKIREAHGHRRVALSGGVWQNITLLEKTIPLLEDDGFEVLIHRMVPPNDGGVSIGQAAIANYSAAANG